MDEKTLLIAAVICAVAGVIILFIISGSVEVEESSINKITNGESEGAVVASGKISRITETEKVIIVDIAKQETVTIVMFKKENEHISLKKGESIQVRGRTEEYQGKNEIIAEEVRIVG